MPAKPYLVGIVGGSGSGKTSFLRELLQRLPRRCAVLSQDNYYRSLEEQERDANGQPNFDLPTAFHLDWFFGDVDKLLRGEAVTRTEYTFNQPDRKARAITTDPADVLIVEGLFLFHYVELRSRIDLRIFIDVQMPLCKARRIERDARERGYSADHVEYQWKHHVLPSYEQFILPYRDDAHLIVANHGDYGKGLEVVTHHLLARLEARH